MIRFDHVIKEYPDDTRAVDDVSFEVPTGSLTMLVGPSGCGKTTSLRMINRLIEPTAGTISLDGQDVTSLDAVELRRGIGYVIQQAGLFPHRTVLDNIAAVPRLLGWPKKRARARAEELLGTVGLEAELGGRYPFQLSGGQQQRVGVARALAADPPVMLMDEPFSAVDPVVRAQLQDEFLRLQSQLGKTIVFVTHDIDEALKLGDRVAVFRTGGRLAQIASPAELLANPADEFVAGFLGRDRGYRSLGFSGDATVPTRSEPTIALGAPVPSAARERWVLVVDADKRPLGWLDAEAVAGGVARARDVNLGATYARAHGSLRAYLDAVLSSPAHRGVVVDADGRLVGSVLAEDVLAVLEAQGDRHVSRGAAR